MLKNQISIMLTLCKYQVRTIKVQAYMLNQSLICLLMQVLSYITPQAFDFFQPFRACAVD